jgi:hypothetical protein
MEEDLKESATACAHYSENTISKLQQAYLKKYHPRQYIHSTQVAPNTKMRGKYSAAPCCQQGVIWETESIQSEDGAPNISNICQFSSLIRRLD